MPPSTKRHLILGSQIESFLVSVILDPDAGTLTAVHTIGTPKSPDWVTKHPTLPLVYAASRPDEGGMLGAYSVSTEGHLTLVQETATGFNDPAAMEVFADGSKIVVAHFLGSGVSMIYLKPDGTFVSSKPQHVFEPTYVPQKHRRQNAAHPHHVVLHKDEIIIPDQGSNCVWRLGYGETGFTLRGVIDDFEEADGPRHGVVHPSGKFLYILNEISSVLSVHTLSDTDSECVARVPIYPPSDAENALGVPMMSSELIMTGGKLICTNRNSPNPEMDAMAILEIHGDGSLGNPVFLWPKAKHLRALSASQDGKFICVAGRDAGGVVVFNDKWKEIARMDLNMIAIPVWM